MAADRSAQPVDVLAVMQEFAIANGSLEMGAARQAVAEQQRILRQLATWNRNPNGDGDELSALCAAAEMLVGKASDDAPKFDVATLPAVAELVHRADDVLNLLEDNEAVRKALAPLMPDTARGPDHPRIVKLRAALARMEPQS